MLGLGLLCQAVGKAGCGRHLHTRFGPLPKLAKTFHPRQDLSQPLFNTFGKLIHHPDYLISVADHCRTLTVPVSVISTSSPRRSA